MTDYNESEQADYEDLLADVYLDDFYVCGMESE